MTESMMDNYNPLYDVHLRQYFALPHMRRHLRRMGLIQDEEGKGDEVYQRHHAMMEMIIKNRETQLMKMAELRRKLDAAEKVETCRRIRSGLSPESYRRTPAKKASRSLSRGRRNSGNERQRRFSNSYDDKEVLTQLEQQYAEPSSEQHYSAPRDAYKRLSANVKKYNYLHKMDDPTLISYKDTLKKQLDRLERFREVTFGIHSVVRHPPPPQTSWFFRRRSLPSLTSSAPVNALSEPLRSINNLRGRRHSPHSKSDIRTSCPPTTRKRKDSNPRFPPISSSSKGKATKSPAKLSQQPVARLPPAASRPSPSTRGRSETKKETRTSINRTTSSSTTTKTSVLPAISGAAVLAGAATALAAFQEPKAENEPVKMEPEVSREEVAAPPVTKQEQETVPDEPSPAFDASPQPEDAPYIEASVPQSPTPNKDSPVPTRETILSKERIEEVVHTQLSSSEPNEPAFQAEDQNADSEDSEPEYAEEDKTEEEIEEAFERKIVTPNMLEKTVEERSIAHNDFDSPIQERPFIEKYIREQSPTPVVDSPGIVNDSPIVQPQEPIEEPIKAQSPEDVSSTIIPVEIAEEHHDVHISEEAQPLQEIPAVLTHSTASEEHDVVTESPDISHHTTVIAEDVISYEKEEEAVHHSDEERGSSPKSEPRMDETLGDDTSLVQKTPSPEIPAAVEQLEEHIIESTDFDRSRETPDNAEESHIVESSTYELEEENQVSDVQIPVVINDETENEPVSDNNDVEEHKPASPQIQLSQLEMQEVPTLSITPPDSTSSPVQEHAHPIFDEEDVDENIPPVRPVSPFVERVSHEIESDAPMEQSYHYEQTMTNSQISSEEAHEIQSDVVEHASEEDVSGVLHSNAEPDVSETEQYTHQIQETAMEVNDEPVTIHTFERLSTQDEKENIIPTEDQSDEEPSAFTAHRSSVPSDLIPTEDEPVALPVTSHTSESYSHTSESYPLQIHEEPMQIPSVQLHITPAPEQTLESDEEPEYASEAERRLEEEDDIDADVNAGVDADVDADGDADNMSTDSMIIHDSPDEINHMTSSVYVERNVSPSQHELNYEETMAQKSTGEIHSSGDDEEEEDKESVRAVSPQHKVHDEEWTQGNEHVKVHSEEFTDNSNGHYISQTVTRVTTTINSSSSENDETNNNDGKDGNESTGQAVHMDHLDDDENNVSSL